MGLHVERAVVRLVIEDMDFGDETEVDSLTDRIYSDISQAARGGCSAWANASIDIDVEELVASPTTQVADFTLTITVKANVAYDPSDENDLRTWVEDNALGIVLEHEWDDVSVRIDDDSTGEDPDNASFDADNPVDNPMEAATNSRDQYRDLWTDARKVANSHKATLDRIRELCERYGANANGLAVWGLINPDKAHELAISHDRLLAVSRPATPEDRELADAIKQEMALDQDQGNA